MQLPRLPSLQVSDCANERQNMIASKSSFEPQSSERLPKSNKVYVPGKHHPSIRVPLREIELSPTKAINGRMEPNEPLRVYDCSGPWGDANFNGKVEQGLPPLREEWILARGDIEPVAQSYRPIPGRSEAIIPHELRRKSLRAKKGNVVTQLQYARQGIITPEMEFIAIRENLGRETMNATAAHKQGQRDLGGEAFGASIP